MYKTFAKNNWITILMHISAWFVLIILPQIIINRYWHNNIVDLKFYFNAVIYITIFYLNYLWLLPRYYFKEKKGTYFGLAMIILVGLFFVLDSINQISFNPERDKEIAAFYEKLSKESNISRPPFRLLQIYGYVFISIIIAGFSFGLRIMERHSISEKRQKELEKEKINSELAFLKNQVSPHFFFNTLNNIYSLIKINSDEAQESVFKLSKLMRYLLYETENGETKLNREVEFMNNYIDLMRLKLANNVELNIHLPNQNSDYTIAPLLFIPFIENAFKHGISYSEKSFINIFMDVEDDKIKFECVNSIGKHSEVGLKNDYSGIGLENVKKRLTLLFPEKHNLIIRQVDKSFIVQLSVQLK